MCIFKICQVVGWCAKGGRTLHRPAGAVLPLVVLHLLCPANAFGQVETREELILDAQQQLHAENYAGALKKGQEIARKWPENPTGMVLQMCVYQAQMRTYRVRRFERSFDSLASVAETLVARLRGKDLSAEMRFICGLASGMAALHRFEQGHWSRALREGVSALEFMRRASMRDPEFPDPKLMLGLYDFWLAEKLGLGVGFMKHRRKAAFKSIEEVWQRGRYLSVDAAFSMQNMLLKNKRIRDARLINDWLVTQFPTHPSVLYHRALILEGIDSLAAAKSTWLTLATRIRSFVEPSHGYLAECYLHVAKLCMKLHPGSGCSAAPSGGILALAVAHAGKQRSSSELESSLFSFAQIRDEIRDLLKRTSKGPANGRLPL